MLSYHIYYQITNNSSLQVIDSLSVMDLMSSLDFAQESYKEVLIYGMTED